MYFGLRHWEFTTPTTLDILGAGARIDLSRADQLDSDRGWAIVQQDTPIGSDGVSLGQGDTLRDVLAGQAVKDAWSSALGTTPEGDTLDQLLFDHLESKADPTGTDTARPLELCEGRLEVWLGIRQRHITPFANGTRSERAAFVRMVQRIRSRLDEARAASTEGRIPATMYRKLLTMEARKIGVSATNLKPKGWRADETPLTPETTVTDSFASFTAYTRVTGGGTWTCNSGLYVYREPSLAVLDTVKNNTPVSANDNWSDLTIQTTSGQALGNGADFGPICRFGSSGSACYSLGSNVGAGSGFDARILRFGASSNTITHLSWFSTTSFSTYGRLLVFRAKAVGSTITGQISGNGNTNTATATDTSVTTGLYGGVGCADNWNSAYATIKVANSIVITDGLADPPVVTSESASGQVGTAFSYQISATNTPTEYGASGLPTGLSVNTSTGAITGTPTQSGSFSVSLSATNTGGTGTGTLTLTISKANTTTSLSASPSSPQLLGASVTLTATVTSGATGTVTFYNGVTSLGTGSLSGTTATLSTSALPVGTNSLTASYGGDSNYNTSTSSSSSYVITKKAASGAQPMLNMTKTHNTFGHQF